MQYRVPYADTDQMGVVYYANYLIYFERLRTELLREAGFPYRELETAGIYLPVIEALCNYKSSARYDDLLTFKGRVAEAGGVRVKIVCEVWRGDELLVSGHTIHAATNREGRPRRLPEELKRLADG
jgi:acyl-CoA thioester hydrolase